MADMKNNTDAAITEALSRGVNVIYPTAEAMREVLARGDRFRIYLGMDATAPHLHLGNAMQLATLERFRRLGCEVIVLFGDFTAMIGDPTDKSAVRTALTKAEVDANLTTWKEQVEKYVTLTGDNPAHIKQNSEWLAALGFSDVVELASHFTVQQMIERDMFEKRLGDGQPIYVHEFLYPLMQGYDSVAMQVDAEIGGTDQIFNMLAGRTLLKQYKNTEKFVVATELLENPDTGKKLMSKSEGDYIAIDTPPADMYGKIMALPDGATIPLLRNATFMSLERIADIEESLASGGNPRDAKMQLAREIVTICHSESEAEEAAARFTETFQSGSMPADASEISLPDNAELGPALVAAGIIASRSEFRRLKEQNAITDMQTGEKVHIDTVTQDMDLRIGKHRFVRIRVKNA